MNMDRRHNVTYSVVRPFGRAAVHERDAISGSASKWFRLSSAGVTLTFFEQQR